jgi:uncharacterized lipoprotein
MWNRRQHVMKNVWMVCGLMLALTGCSTMTSLFHQQDIIQSRDNDYLKSQAVAPLQAPTGIASSQLGDDYPLPRYNYPVPTQAVSKVPPGIAAAQ